MKEFRTTIPDDTFGPKFRKPPKKDDTLRRLFGLWLPLGFVIGVVAGVITQSDAVWLPVWGVATFLLYAADAGSRGEDGRE